LNNILSKTPLCRIILPFITGILLAIYIPSKSYIPFYFLCFVICIYVLLLSVNTINSNYKFRSVYGIIIHLILGSCGFCLTQLKSNENQPLKIKGIDSTMIGEIISPLLTKEKTIKTTLLVRGIKTDNQWISHRSKIIVYLQKDSLSTTLKIGNYLLVNSPITNISPPKNPGEFDYKKYLSYRQINQQTYLRSTNWKLVNNIHNTSLHSFANEIRKKLILILKQNGITDKELGVASALILGYKGNIDPQLKSAYSNAGVMHVLAVSGLHVGIIFMVFNSLLQFLEKIKYGSLIKVVILLFVLWLYALITGLSPSVLRASVMFSFIALSKSLNRKSNFFNTLAASAFLLLIINPYYLVDVGFQLSYIAVIGIVIIQPWINNLLVPKYWITQQIWGLTTVSIAAQIATFPLSLYYFHQFPNYFMLSNILIIPMATGVLYLGLLTLSFSSLPFLSNLFAFLLNKLILILNKIINCIDSLPYSVSTDIRFSLLNAIIVYSIIIFTVVLIHYRKFNYLLTALLLTIVLLFDRGVSNYKISEQKMFIIYSIPKHLSINFIDGQSCLLFSDIKTRHNKSQLMYHVKNDWIDKGIKNGQVIGLDTINTNYTSINDLKLLIKPPYFQYYNTKIAIIDDTFKSFESKNKLTLDLIVWSKNNAISLHEILKTFRFKKLIIDSSNSDYTNTRLKNEATSLNIPYWSVIDSGAYTKNIEP